MISVEVRHGNLDAALQALKKKTGPHLKEISRRVQFAKPSERRKAKEAVAKRRKKRSAARQSRWEG